MLKRLSPQSACLLLLLLIPVTCRGQSFHKAAAPSPAAGSMFITPERIALKDGGFFTAFRGQMFVPLNRANPESDRISIEFFHFPRESSANPNTPPMFMLRGGPGFEGLDGMLSQAGQFEQNIQMHLATSDLIIVGQRGIGSSRPNTLIRHARPPGLGKSNTGEATATFQDSIKEERQYWIDQGLDLSGFNAREAATDVRDIAKGLGFEQIMISGGSFGSHWGMTLMRQHPELVARAVLHGMEGPDHTWDNPGGIWNVYRRVAEDAEASTRLQDLVPEGGLVNAVEQLVLRAESKPIAVILNAGKSNEQEVIIDGDAMRWLARGYTRILRTWPAEVIEMHHGNMEKAARRVAMQQRGGVGSINSTASFWMLDSSSGISPQRLALFKADPALQIIGSTFDFYEMGSPIWEADLGEDFRASFKTDIPTVIVHGTWDLSTPYENATELAPWFTNGTLVTVERGSHGALGEALDADKDFRNALGLFMTTGDRSGFPEKIQLDAPKWKVPVLDLD